MVTFPPDPTVTGIPFKVSLLVNGEVFPPEPPLIAGVVSVMAHIYP